MLINEPQLKLTVYAIELYKCTVTSLLETYSLLSLLETTEKIIKKNCANKESAIFYKHRDKRKKTTRWCHLLIENLHRKIIFFLKTDRCINKYKKISKGCAQI